MKPSARNSNARHQRGLGLVEIMISITLGLAVTAGLIQVFVGNKQVYRVQEALARLQENGRFAIDFITRDVRGAGFLGCAAYTTPVVNTLNNAGSLAWNFASPIQGFQAISPTAWSPSLDPTIISALAGSDVITIRRSQGNPYTVVGQPAAMPAGSGPIQVTSTTGLSVDDVALISDCNDSAIFQITGITLGNNLQHTADGSSPGNATNAFPKDFTSTADVVRLSTTTYYIRSTGTASGRPALWRQDGAALAQELVEGVQDMQIRYGVDTDPGNSDKVPNQYMTADAVALAAAWSRVVSVRVDLLLQTIDDNLADAAQPYTFDGAPPVTPGDRRLRRVFTATIGIRNRSL